MQQRAARLLRHNRVVLKLNLKVSLAVFLVLLSIIPFRLALAYRQAPQAEAILVLGGGQGREEAAAQLAKYHPDLAIWISSGDAHSQQVYGIFQAAGVSPDRVYPDYRATDTVTNFTTLVQDFRQHHVQHIYLVTSDFHMQRATVIATLVLGSSGIAFTPVSVPSNRPPESWWRIVRDAGRSLLWILTGRTGSSLRQLQEAYLPSTD